MGKISEENLRWRRRQKSGAIMSPETFEKIKQDALARGLSEERASKSAGFAYWQGEKKKFRERKKE